MRIYIDKCGYNFNKATAIIENALAFVEKADFDYHEAIRNLAIVEKTINEMAAAIFTACVKSKEKEVKNDAI